MFGYQIIGEVASTLLKNKSQPLKAAGEACAKQKLNGLSLKMLKQWLLMQKTLSCCQHGFPVRVKTLKVNDNGAEALVLSYRISCMDSQDFPTEDD